MEMGSYMFPSWIFYFGFDEGAFSIQECKRANIFHFGDFDDGTGHYGNMDTGIRGKGRNNGDMFILIKQGIKFNEKRRKRLILHST